MSDRLPPLTALRAFEAAARHLSFAAAADELNVTPAALSFQIKSLEEHLGQPVFLRLNRAVQLTEAGRTLAPGLSDAMQAMNSAWRATRRLTDERTLNVTAGPAFTAKWLAPRFYDFAKSHPDIDLRFSATLRLLDFERDEVDLAVRFGEGTDEGFHSTPVEYEWVMPVMTPELAAEYPTVESLISAPLFIDHSMDFLRHPAGWAEWFRCMGVEFSPDHGAHFSQADHAVDAALAGAGVALGRRSIVIKDLYEGRLVAPFKTAIVTKGRFRIICRKGLEDQPRIKAFREWVLAEIRKTASVHDELTLINVEDLP